MKAKRFCIWILTISAFFVIVLVGINYVVDLFGLFHNDKGRSISIYADERTSKYLLAYNYVPANFEAYIIGPSLSANLNPKIIPEYKIYNFSMMGANITEQKAVVDKALEKSAPAFVIICLHPYLTFDHGMKTNMINPREYYGALGSISLYKSYALKFIRDRNLLPSKYPGDQFNDYGWNHYNSIIQKMPVEDKIREQLGQKDAIRASIDPVAMKEFTDLVDTLTKRHISIIGYFHPLPFPIYDKFRGPLEEYQAKMTTALASKALLVNFNSPEFQFFTKDLTNYIDHGHLSDKGQVYILREILKKSNRVN